MSETNVIAGHFLQVFTEGAWEDMNESPETLESVLIDKRYLEKHDKGEYRVVYREIHERIVEIV